MSTKARPRPRPRIAKRTAADADPATNIDILTASGSSVQLGANTQVKNSTLLDEDDLFLRNRGRTKQDWKQLQQLSRIQSISASADNADDDSEYEDMTEYSPKHRKKKQNKQSDIPRWQAVDITELLSSDNEGDDDLEIVESKPSTEREHNSPRKRKRTRSRSITPPPPLPAHQLANARSLVRQALAIEPRAPSPTYLADESTDTIVLDPELATIAEAVRKEVQQAQNETEGGPEVVTLKVRWRPHPLNVSVGSQVWIFKMKRTDTFRDLFEEVADLAAVLVDQIVVSYDNKRVYSSGTPSSLHIWAEGELEACDKRTDEYIRANRHRWSASPPLHDDDKPSTRSLSPLPSDAESEAESTGGDKLKLVFRSVATKDKNITLTVRSTTTCGAIVKAFLQAAELPDVYPSGKGKKRVPYPQLMIDGDKMASDAVIGDAGLEDNDLVEVVGLSGA